MKYLLDTNVCVDYLNQRYPSVAARIQDSSPEDLCLSSVVVAELRYGADRSARQRRNHERLDVLTAEIQCLHFDLAAARVFGRIRAALEAEGFPIGRMVSVLPLMKLMSSLQNWFQLQYVGQRSQP